MAMPNEGGFTFTNFLADVFAVFVFVVLIWLLYIVLSDLFRRHDISGWGKALWVIGLVLFPYIGVLAYMIVESKGMAERADQQAQQTQDEVRRVVGFSVADEIKNFMNSRNQDRSPTRNTRVCAAGWFSS
jgi:Phospholipase_D-nuclease N-terminal